LEKRLGKKEGSGAKRIVGGKGNISFSATPREVKKKTNSAALIRTGGWEEVVGAK